MAKYVSPRRDPKDLARYGPRLEIQLGPPILRVARQMPAAAPSTAKLSRLPALIDTGAGRTVITPEVVQKTGLSLVNYTTLSRVGGFESNVGVYVASIQFPKERLTTIEIIEVACCELPGNLFQCLLGRDILSRWLFTYDGKAGGWTIDEEDLGVWVEPPEGI